jgi:hypothetical protein
MTDIAETAPSPLDFLELEITELCNLRCVHCYMGGSPKGTHGSMTAEDWERVITQAAGYGVKVLQVIGGEAPLHPELPRLVRHALSCGLQATVYSNLTRVTPALWELFRLPGVRLAVSWFADSPEAHAAVTGSMHAYAATSANIARAVELRIPIRAMVIEVLPGQDIAAAKAAVRALGVVNVKSYRQRLLGRADREGNGENPDELCGGCGGKRAAVLSDGQLVPCTMARWLPGGSVHESSLADLFGGDAWRAAKARVPARVKKGCPPDDADNSPPDDETVDPSGMMPATVAR